MAQEVAFAEDQVIVGLVIPSPPTTTFIGLAEIVTVGGVGGSMTVDAVTVTEAIAGVVPAAPVQVIVYV